jgi:hypothetical protein
MYGVLAHHSEPSPDADAFFSDWRELPALLDGRLS